MKTKISCLILGLGLLFTLACTKYPPATDRLLTDLAVFTQYDLSANFNQYKTFSIPDSIGVITTKDSIKVKNANTAIVINEIIEVP